MHGLLTGSARIGSRRQFRVVGSFESSAVSSRRQFRVAGSFRLSLSERGVTRDPRLKIRRYCKS